MTNWTPGPWMVYVPEGYEGPTKLPGLGIEAEDGTAVVWFAHITETGIQHDRDAHLIAAAPDLYEAGEKALAELETLVAIVGPDPTKHPACANLRAALAKARGEA